MKKGWEYKELGELCHKFNGLWKGKKAPFVRVGVIRNANFTKAFTLDFSNIEYLDVEEKQYASRKLQLGDLIVEKSGGSEKQPVGRAVLFQEKEGEYSFSNFTSVLRVKDNHEITPEFLYKYILHVYLRGDTRKMQKATTGIHNIEFDKYLAINIPIPPLSEQKEIVEYLDSSFAKIDKLKENAAKNLEEAKALFQSALKEALEPKKGWEEKSLNELCSIKSKLVNPTLPEYVNMTHVGGANIMSRSGEFIDLKSAKEEGLTSGKFYFDSNVVLYNKIRPYLMKVGRPDFDGLCSADMYPLTPFAILDKGFLFYILISDDFTGYAVKGSARARMPKVNRDYLFAYKCRIPLDIQEQQEIVSRLDSLNEKVNTLQQNYSRICSECDALKQAILRQVFE